MGSDNGLPPIRRQAIIQTNAGVLSIGPLGTARCEILIKTQNFSFMKLHLNLLFTREQPFLSRGDELRAQQT